MKGSVVKTEDNTFNATYGQAIQRLVKDTRMST